MDRTLGRLVRWLRLLGYDTVWESEADPAELLDRTEREGRTLLTRDTLLVERRAVRLGRVRAVLVRDDRLPDQLAQLRCEEGLRRVGPPRCLVCNGVLQPLGLDQVRGRVPPYVAATQRAFSYCAGCDRVTWPATHWADMQRRLAAAGFGEGLRGEEVRREGLRADDPCAADPGHPTVPRSDAASGPSPPTMLVRFPIR